MLLSKLPNPPLTKKLFNMFAEFQAILWDHWTRCWKNYLLETPRMPSHLRGPHLDRMEGGIDHHPDWAGRPSLQQESSLQVFDPRIPDSAPADSEESNASPKSKLRISKCQPVHILWGNCALMLLVRTEVAFPPVGHPKSLKPQTSVKLHFSASPPIKCSLLFGLWARKLIKCPGLSSIIVERRSSLSQNGYGMFCKKQIIDFESIHLLKICAPLLLRVFFLSCWFCSFFPGALFSSCAPSGGDLLSLALASLLPLLPFSMAFNKVASNSLSHYMYLGMALKTLWIVPRWSRRLERGGCVKGHDPEVSKAPTGRSCFHDMTSYVYMSPWLDQRSHGKVERSISARPGIVFTLRILLDCKHSCYRWHEFQS